MSTATDLRFEVARRKPTDNGYQHEPYYVAVYAGDEFVAIQFGSQPGIAFQKAWSTVRQLREREPLRGAA